MKHKIKIRRHSATCFLWQVFALSAGKPALLVGAGYCASKADAMSDAYIWVKAHT